MEDEILFRERQRFTQPWLWVVMLLAGGTQARVLIALLKSKEVSGAAFIGLAVYCFVIVFILLCHLDTIIKQDGIHVRFFPFHFSERFFAWHQLTKSYVRKYRPIGEFGGWGLRGIFRTKRAWNVSGNMGIQLEMQDGAKLLIGTNKPDEAKEMLKRLGHLTEPSNS
jgi:hypothetical protein